VGHTCPSGQAGPGATLLGIVGPGGRVVFTPRGPRITAELRTGLADRAGDGSVESRYRFATACAESGCAFWDGACRALSAAREDYGEHSAPDVLPECGIRETCRWWAQEGAAACGVCVHVRTAAT
jgi:hypothetical protein